MTREALSRDAKIYVAGHLGMVSSAIARALETDGYTNRGVHTHAELDLVNRAAVRAFFQREKLIGKIAGFSGRIEFDLTKPDGTPRKLLDALVLRQLGWKHQRTLEEDLSTVYRWFSESSAA